MKTPLEKELKRCEQQEKRQRKKHHRSIPMKETLYEKVPEKVRISLEAAFMKAFELVFLKGTKVIEKTFDKEQAQVQFEANHYVVEKVQSKQSFRIMDKSANKHHMINHVATTLTGTGMGLIGLGLPDIPIMVTTMLKGIYEIAIGYGFTYDTDQEKVYILRLIRAALADNEEKEHYLWEVDHLEEHPLDLIAEMKLSAKVLSDALLVEKFIQGIPVIGVIGGYVNHSVYTRTSKLASIKYKKRYLQQTEYHHKSVHKL